MGETTLAMRGFMGVEVAVGAAVIGTALEMQGNRRAARDQQSALNEQARLKNIQAQDVMKRFELNRSIMRREGRQFGAQQEAAFAKGGVAAGGATLQALENTMRQTAEQIKLEQFESEAQAEALMAGAKVDLQTGRRIRKAERRGRIGTLFNSASNIAGAF